MFNKYSSFSVYTGTIDFPISLGFRIFCLFIFTERKAPVFTDMPSVFVVNRNDRITIHLNVMDGVPSANYSCYHENHLLISCSGKEIDKIDLSTDHLKPACSQDNYDITGIHGFVIKDATYTRNDGMYKCEARNIIGTDSVYFRVNVTGWNCVSIISSLFLILLHPQRIRVRGRSY